VGSLGGIISTSADLSAHILDPQDAHFAGAIGVPTTYPPTGAPLLSSVGGPFDGESVLDVLVQVAGLLPSAPDRLGFDGAVVNSGVTNWGALGLNALTGGFANGAAVRFTKNLLPDPVASFTAQGNLYPADRGVLAVYTSTTGNFLDGASTLVGALWLGSTASQPVALTVASANFSEINRDAGQGDYVPSLVGTDKLALTFRLPVLSDYSAFPLSGYANFPQRFTHYQLAQYAIASPALAPGDNGSILFAHWKPAFAVSDAAIAGGNLTLVTLTSTNAYSAVPTLGDFDTGDVVTLNRRFIFSDADSGTAPSGVGFASALANSPSTKFLSGIAYMDGAAAPLFNIDVQFNDLFNDSFNTDATPDGVNTPLGFGSLVNPVALDFSRLGNSTLQEKSYNELQQAGGSPYTPAFSPQPGHTGELSLLGISPGVLSPIFTRTGTIRVHLRKPYQPAVLYIDTTNFLVNTYPNPPSVLNPTTETKETFKDEFYRYLTTVSVATTKDLVPGGGDVYVSASTLALGDGNLQVDASKLVYPQGDYSSPALYLPTPQPDYSSFPASDPLSHIRSYVRAFNTTQVVNKGKLRIKGVVPAAFAATTAWTGDRVADHLGGMVVELFFQDADGPTVKRADLGRPKGSPDLLSEDTRGCLVGKEGSGVDWTYTFELPWFNWKAASGKCPLFVRVSYFKSAGVSHEVTEVEYLPLV